MTDVYDGPEPIPEEDVIMELQGRLQGALGLANDRAEALRQSMETSDRLRERINLSEAELEVTRRKFAALRADRQALAKALRQVTKRMVER